MAPQEESRHSSVAHVALAGFAVKGRLNGGRFKARDKFGHVGTCPTR